MNINFTAPFCDTSYGLVGLNTLKELTLLGHHVSIYPIGGVERIEGPEQFHPFIRTGLANAKHVDYYAPSIRLWHQFDLAQHVGCGRRIGWPIFELDKFNDVEKNHIYNQDSLIVCSKWAKDVVLKNQPDRWSKYVYVVPLGVDQDIFKPEVSNKSTDKTIFINVGKKEVRKGHDILLECFETAFNENDNVELWMIWGNRILDHMNQQESASWTDMYASARLKDKIYTQWECTREGIKGYNLDYCELTKPVGASFTSSQNTIFEWLPNQQAVAYLLNRADCAIFPSRAEGFNLDALEAMACGLPTIITNHSAHTEYANNENACLIEGNKLDPAYDGIWFHMQGNWLKIDQTMKNFIVEQMRNIHTRKQSGESIYNEAGVNTASQFTWKNSALKLLEVLNDHGVDM